MKQRILIIGALAIVLGAGVFTLRTFTIPETVPSVATTTPVVRCDTDAKLCPDGTTVLREGDRCEFAACPSPYGDQKDWRTRTDDESGVSFRYPETLGSAYVRAQEWPPYFSIRDGAYECVPADNATAAEATVSEEVFAGARYCVQSLAEGAAGSTYTTYDVSFLREDKMVTMSFVIQTVQCLNYDGSEQSACQAAQEVFKVVELVAKMAETLSV